MLGRDFFSRDTITVARELLGKQIHVLGAAGELRGRIVETEAYLGQDDPASHAASGPTPRSSIMFGPAGVAYVYFIYGVHHCLNFVTEVEGKPGAVLIRALEPFLGQQTMAKNRGLNVSRFRDSELCSGPGKLCRAFGIDRHWNNVVLDGAGEQKIWLAPGVAPVAIEASTRIGISKAADLPLRFFDPSSTSLSR